MSSIPSFPEGSIEALARVLAECSSGSDISRVLANCRIQDNSGESTKWRRLYSIFLDIQEKDRCANRILNFIQSFLTPARFAGKNDAFESHRAEMNTILLLSGFEYGPDGKFRRCEAAKTLSQAESRTKTIKAKFQGRRIHPEVFRYCRAELMQENYFHAVLEASKGLEQRVREKSGVDGSGTTLIERVFSIKEPLLAFNTLQTETEKSEHIGFASLLKGCLMAVRNPLAHEPKIMWEGEDDAADYFTLISLLQRKLDDCVATNATRIE